MLSKIITAFPAGTVKSTDVYPAVDVTDLSQALTGTDKKYTIQQLLEFLTAAIGPLIFKGTWNATTNTPTLASGIGTNGEIYIVSVAGTTTLDGISSWAVGDWAVFNGTVWQKIDNTQIGDVVGPASATDNAIVRFDAATGRLIQNSSVTISDTFGIFSGAVIPKAGNTVTASSLATTTADVNVALAVAPTVGQVLTATSDTTSTWQTPAGGNVVGPVSATDNAIPRFDTTTGKLIQNSIVTIADTSGLLTVNNATQPYFFGPNASAHWVLVGDQTTGFEKLVYIQTDGRIYSLADFILQYGVSGADVTNTVENTFANAASHAVFLAQTGAAGGDPKSVYTNQVTSFSAGIDNSDNDAYKVSTGTALGTTDDFIVQPTGEVRFPRTSAFSAHLSSSQANVTGDGTVYAIIFNSEEYDLNADYNNSTSVFTAPIDGVYKFNVTVCLGAVGALHTAGNIQFMLNGSQVTTFEFNPAALRNSSSNSVTVSDSRSFLLSATNTVSIRTQVTGSTKTIDMSVGSGIIFTNYFSGELIA